VAEAAVKGLRTFIGLLVVMLALGAYLYFVESKRPAGGDAEKKDRAFTVEAEKIEEVTIKAESGERTTLRKNGSDWAIAEPVAAKPDAAAVSGITSNLASLEVQRVIEENPADLAEYGLAQPRVEIHFKAGGESHKLAVGRKTPPGTDLYARLDDQKRVVLVSSFLDTTFNRTTFDLRDKAVLAVNRDEIGSLTVATGPTTMRFEKSGGDWRVVQPLNARADFSAVEGLVSRFTTLQMKSIVAPQADDLRQYGLDKPVATVTIGSGSSQAVLAIGKPSGEGAVYARDASKPLVVTVESGLLDELKKGPGEYRQKDLFEARAFNANRVDLTRNGSTTTFEKMKGKGQDGQEQDVWKQTAPAAKDVDHTKVDNLISTLTQTRAAAFLDGTTAAAVDKPELTVTIKFNDGKREETVTFGRRPGEVVASRAGERGAVTLEATALDAAVKALEEIR
jgi:hypothetical protein